MRSLALLRAAHFVLSAVGISHPLSRLRDLVRLFRPVAQAASTVFCASNIWLGMALGAALGLVPLYLFAASGAVLLACGLARALRLPAAMLADGSLTYNVLLSALAVVWITREADIDATVFVALLLGATVAALALSAALLHFVPRVAGLPPLSLAFTLIFGSLITLFPHWSAASVLAPLELPGLPVDLPPLLAGFLQSLGTVLFLPHPFAGLAIAIALFAWSRLALVYAGVGYLTGMLAVWALDGLGVAFHGAAAGHNYLLAGLALGAVYFVPSRASLGLAAVAGACAALAAGVLQRLLSGSGWEYLPLPFILTVWTLLCALRLRTRARGLVPAASVASNPEALWRSHARAALRFPGGTEPHLALPVVAGGAPLTVTQGFAGALSHRGPWRHALDFELHDAAGLPHARGTGARIEDYYTFGLAVAAPGAGIVLRVVDDIADNAPGACNYARSWGNHVVLQLDGGAHVTLAHFREKGIRVAPGQRVAAGQVLGECGSSGRSPVPHLHLQAQTGAAAGAHTVPFRVANYLEHDAAGSRWIASGVPQAGERVSPAPPDARLLACLARVAPGRTVFRVRRNPERIGAGAPMRREVLACRLDDHGRHVLSSGDGQLVAVAGLNAWHTLECEPGQSQLVWLLGLALACAPYAHASAMRWEDRVDWPAPQSGWGIRLARLGRDFAAPLSGKTHGGDGIRVSGRYLAVTDTQTTLCCELDAADAAPAAGLPERIELTLEPVRGVTALAATFARETVHWQLASFEPR